MKLDREQFLAALLAAGVAGATGCSKPAPAAETPAESTGEEMAMSEAPAPAMAEAELPAEEEPEVEQPGPTRE